MIANVDWIVISPVDSAIHPLNNRRKLYIDMFLNCCLTFCLNVFHCSTFRVKALSHISVKEHYLRLEQLNPCLLFFFFVVSLFFSVISVHLNNRTQKIAIKTESKNRSIRGLCETLATDKWNCLDRVYDPKVPIISVLLLLLYCCFSEWRMSRERKYGEMSHTSVPTTPAISSVKAERPSALKGHNGSATIMPFDSPSSSGSGPDGSTP